MKQSSINKLNEITSIGETRFINGKKTLILPYVEPEYQPKKRRSGKGKISKAFKNKG